MSPLPPELAELLGAADPAARESAWDRFLETHSHLLLHTARGLGREYDATMDAYAYLLEQLRSDDFHRLRAYSAQDSCKFSTWLVVVARRLCQDRVRHVYGRRGGTGIQSAEAERTRRRLVDLIAEEIDASELADPTNANPETHLRASELNQALLAALSDLEARDRLLLQLRFVDGLAARDIGLIMGFATPFHVYRRLNALLEQLRMTLGRRGVGDPEP